MMEQIVRPFQSPTFINDKKTITILPKVAKTSAPFEWGGVGAPPTINGVNFSVKQGDKIYKQKSGAVTTDVRMQNPDDPNQYIMEKRINKISFDTKDVLPQTSVSGSGTSGGSIAQTGYSNAPTDTSRLTSYNALVAQGVDPSIASTMAYGNQYTAGKVIDPLQGYNSNFELTY